MASNIVQLIVAGKLQEAKRLIESGLLSEMDKAIVNEKREIKIKVSSKGVRRKKLVCGKGMKSVNGKCVPQSSGEKLTKKKSLRKAVKTKKAAGAGAKRKTNILRKKALKKRKGMGL